MVLEKKSLFSNRKKGLFYSLSILIIVSFFCIWINFLSIEEIKSSVFVILIFIALVSFNIQNFYHYQKFFFYKKKLIKKDIEFKTGNCLVELLQSSYAFNPYMSNREVIIDSAPRIIRCNYLCTKDGFIFTLQYFFFLNLIQRERLPMIIAFNEELLNLLEIKKNRVIPYSATETKDTSLIIISPETHNDYKWIKIIDFHSHIM